MRTRIIIIVLVFLGLIALAGLVWAAMQNRTKAFDGRVSLRQKDKIPYGYYVVRKMVPSLFKGARVRSSYAEPGKWVFHPDSSGQVVFLPCIRFNASDEEMADIYRFASNGNHVFIISRHLSYEAKSFLKFTAGGLSNEGYLEDDGLTVKLVPPLVEKEEQYKYEGRKYSAVFNDPDTNRLFVFGRNEEGAPNFVQRRAGSGTISVHVAPLAFSNFFLLQENNINYLERAFAAIPADVRRVDWNEYYFTKKDISGDKEPNWLSVLFKFPSFRWAFLVALGLLVLYTVLEMRRRQRMIPVIKKPANDSLDFVQTIGRLYYDRKDHKDLAMKMTAYFLEDVRNRYKLPTVDLDDTFVSSLQMKSGYPAKKLVSLIESMNFIRNEPDISEETVFAYHKQLEDFYQST
jgi:hypothetical protein